MRRHVEPWRYPPVMDILYGEWHRLDYRAGMIPERAETPDVATLITMVRATGQPLAGPAAAGGCSTPCRTRTSGGPSWRGSRPCSTTCCPTPATSCSPWPGVWRTAGVRPCADGMLTEIRRLAADEGR